MQIDYNIVNDTIISSFRKVGIHSVEMLHNEDLVRRAAEIAYKRLPAFPVRAAVKVILGKDGFVNLVFKVRDKLIKVGKIDVDSIGSDPIM